jgi:hypothetical protein
MLSITDPGGGKILEPTVVHPEPPSIKNNKIPAEGQDGNLGPKFVFFICSNRYHTILTSLLLPPVTYII